MGDYGLNKRVYLYRDSFSVQKLRNGKAQHQIDPCLSLMKGFEKFGYRAELLDFVHAKKTAPDIGIMFNFWSRNKPGLSKQFISEWHIKNNIPLICMDAGVFTSHMSMVKPGSHKRVGWLFHRFGLNSPLGTGEYFNDDSDNKQFELYQSLFPSLQIEPWRQGSKVLVLAQNPIGFQFQDKLTYHQWINKTVVKVLQNTDRPVEVRMHPNSKLSGMKGDRKIVSIDPHKRVTISGLQGRKNLFENLDDVHCCITHSSSAAVDTIMAGIPTFVLSDRCITTAGKIKVWEDDLSNIENITYSEDRYQWACNLAYTSYTHKQLAGESVAEKFLRGLNML